MIFLGFVHGLEKLSAKSKELEIAVSAPEITPEAFASARVAPAVDVPISRVALIQQTSRGIPPAVNNLAVQSLVATFAEGKGMVDEVSARAAVAEVTSD